MGCALERMHFADVGLASYPRSPASARLAHVRKGPFASFATPAVQLSSLVPAHPLPIGPKGLFVLNRLVRPAPALLPPLRNIRSHTPLGQLRQQTIILIAFVHHRLGDPGFTARQHQIGFGQLNVTGALCGSDLSAKVTVVATMASLTKSTACSAL